MPASVSPNSLRPSRSGDLRYGLGWPAAASAALVSAFSSINASPRFRVAGYGGKEFAGCKDARKAAESAAARFPSFCPGGDSGLCLLGERRNGRKGVEPTHQ